MYDAEEMNVYLRGRLGLPTRAMEGRSAEMCTVLLRKLMCVLPARAEWNGCGAVGLGGLEFATTESTAGMRATELPLRGGGNVEVVSAW